MKYHPPSSTPTPIATNIEDYHIIFSDQLRDYQLLKHAKTKDIEDKILERIDERSQVLIRLDKQIVKASHAKLLDNELLKRSA